MPPSAFQQYLEEVARLKAEAAEAKKEKERSFINKFAKPIGIYYENGEPCLNLPEAPKIPNPGDCCNNGCNPCILDIYREDIQQHSKVVAELKREFDICISERGKSNIITPTITLPPPEDGRQLSIRTYKPFNVISIRMPCRDTIEIIGEVPESDCESDRKINGLGVLDGQHVLIRAQFDGITHTKAYTPITHPDEKKFFRIYIKTYHDHIMSSYFKSISPGDHLMMRGPVDSGFRYTSGVLSLLLLLCGGSGITPMYQILLRIVKHAHEDHTKVILVYSITAADVIWLKEEIEDIANEKLRGRLHVWFVITEKHSLSRPLTPIPDPIPSQISLPSQSLISTINNRGRIQPKLLLDILRASSFPVPPRPEEPYHVLVCGGNNFNVDMVGYLKEIGVSLGEDNLFLFK